MTSIISTDKYTFLVNQIILLDKQMHRYPGDSTSDSYYYRFLLSTNIWVKVIFIKSKQEDIGSNEFRKEPLLITKTAKERASASFKRFVEGISEFERTPGHWSQGVHRSLNDDRVEFELNTGNW